MYMQYSSTTEQVRHHSMLNPALSECEKSEGIAESGLVDIFYTQKQLVEGVF